MLYTNMKCLSSNIIHYKSIYRNIRILIKVLKEFFMYLLTFYTTDEHVKVSIHSVVP